MKTPRIPAALVDSVRRFNRFHTRIVGALNHRLLESPFTLAQVRVIYEVATARRALSAADLGRILSMDAGYLSRLLAGLIKQGLIARQRSEGHGRRSDIVLTEAGRAAFTALNTASAKEVSALLARLSATGRAQLVGAMKRIERLLGDGPDTAPILLRDPAPGDLGTVIQRQAELYATEYGWDWTFEGLVARIVGDYVTNHDPASERCWIAECEGEVVGSIFLVRGDASTAKLRMLYVDASMRGRGLGTSLVEASLKFARETGYETIQLWTNDNLVEARRLYERAGFTLTGSDPHHSFGKDLIGQTWQRAL